MDLVEREREGPFAGLLDAGKTERGAGTVIPTVLYYWMH